ncbi:MAG TPA: hypothetical protein VGQ13_05410 [Nitrososphaera sp.]|jgi:hypothetical protein|nr:hypothetical protein [Nitrososphaera sp.]
MPSDGSVDGIEVYPEYGSILLTLDVGSQSGQGELAIILPRGLIDSKEGGVDSEFLVIVDGEDVEYEETQTTGTERVLTFPLPEDAFEVEIFGTQVVPEFPLAIVTIASSAMIGLVLIFQRIRRIRFSL